MYNGFKSYCVTPSSGVPQGSNLELLLFIIFNDGITDILSPDMLIDLLLFADDLKIFPKTTSTAFYCKMFYRR